MTKKVIMVDIYDGDNLLDQSGPATLVAIREGTLYFIYDWDALGRDTPVAFRVVPGNRPYDPDPLAVDPEYDELPALIISDWLA